MEPITNKNIVVERNAEEDMFLGFLYQAIRLKEKNKEVIDLATLRAEANEKVKQALKIKNP